MFQTLRRNGKRLAQLALLTLWGLGYAWHLYAMAGFRFVGEKITIRLLAMDRIGFTGIYEYENSALVPVRRTLRYPLVIAPDHPFPERIMVTEQGMGPVPFATDGAENLFFEIELAPGERKCLTVTFQQPAPGHWFRYILTTTRSWPHPLDQAEFRLERADVPVVWTENSLERIPGGHEAHDAPVVVHAQRTVPGSVGLASGTATSVWRFGSFWPDRDLTLTWKEQ